MRKKISIEEFVSYPIEKTFRIHRRGVGSDDTFDFRAWRKTNPCKENRFHVMCGICYEAEEFLLIINGSYVTNFNSTVSSGSDQEYHFLELLLQWKSMQYHRRGAWSYKGRDNENAMS